MLAWIASLMLLPDVLCLQETHTTDGVWDEWVGWCWKRKYVVWGTATQKPSDGLVILTHEGTEKDWKCIQYGPDVTMAIVSQLPEDLGSTLYNNRFSSHDMSLRVRQITNLADLIKQVQNPSILSTQPSRLPNTQGFSSPK